MFQNIGSDVVVGVLPSFIYDCLKAGTTYITREMFGIGIDKNEVNTKEEFDRLHDLSNQILSELREQNKKFVTKEELLDIVKKYYITDNKEFRRKMYNISLMRAKDFFEQDNYDRAIKLYDEAELYADNNDEIADIYWEKFICNILIESAYRYYVEYENHYCDIKKVCNYSDYNISRIISNIKSQLKIKSSQAQEIFNCFIKGVECSFAPRRFAISKDKVYLAERSISLTDNEELKQYRIDFLNDCISFS